MTNLPTPNAEASLSYIKWLRTARVKQVEPKGDDWGIWLILAGRGWGKTRTGAENIVHYAIRNPDSRVAVVAPTFGDLRRVCFDGDSGINSIIPHSCYLMGEKRKGYNRSGMEIYLNNGSLIQGFSATEPDRMRGPQYHRAWCDELAAWRYEDAWDQLQFGMRLGDNPQTIITTTPRPTKLVASLLGRDDVVTTRGNTFENEANLAASALRQFRERYEGTRLGRQELYAEVLDDVEGALWTLAMIEETRIKAQPELRRIVVSIDPAVTAGENSDETGIIVAGVGQDGRYYILEDLSGRYSADTWAKKAVDAYYSFKADRVIAEVNNGGDLVERLIRTVDTEIPYQAVRASRGKLVRAEPVSALYEQRKVSHVGVFPELEDQMCSYTALSRESPDRLDALVWALTDLSKSSGQAVWRVS